MKEINLPLADLRKAYVADTLDKSQIHQDPFEQFAKWMEQALSIKGIEANAMTLATSNANGQPSARIVLLKGFTNDGLVFYTNYESRKGEELLKNPLAALLFYWEILERQIRIEGKVARLSPEKSDAYFHSRPKGSQIGAIASPQSQVIGSRAILEDKVKTLSQKYENTSEIPRPKNWGGFLLQPQRFEFWQGRANRLHDRFQYTLKEDQNWSIERLAP